jgi:hypothetical protein
MTKRVIDILESRRSDANEAALAELRHDTQDWSADTLKLKPDELQEDEEAVALEGDSLERHVPDSHMLRRIEIYPLIPGSPPCPLRGRVVASSSPEEVAFTPTVPDDCVSGRRCSRHRFAPAWV